MRRYTYAIVVDELPGGLCEARLAHEDGTPSPMRGCDESPLQAVRQLCESIREWPISGAKRWLASPDGVRLARKFVPDFEPDEPGASS